MQDLSSGGRSFKIRTATAWSKNRQAPTHCNNTRETLSHSWSGSGPPPPRFSPARPWPAVNTSPLVYPPAEANCTQSGDGGWCVRWSQGHPSTGWEPACDRAPGRSGWRLFTSSCLAPAWPLRLRANPKTQFLSIYFIFTHTEFCRSKESGAVRMCFPSKSPSLPSLIVSFPSKAEA